ncbi:phage major capsid protein [Guyparkeria hydrothermalis]|uniref:phage major capsid protein n=1 Tax=Guyparkeria hydrothermalis TaxID=923 RepID=UPI002021F5C1|nr:phage major capsid protein [Guyparkeria hydrothermalis]MCL7744361.1 phage major capsid protein [Guyparkeria hydrothermalis]
MDPARKMNAVTELSKLGDQSLSNLLNDTSDPATTDRKELIQKKAELRRGLNALRDEASKSLDKKDFERSDSITDAMHAVGDYIAALDYEIDMQSEVAAVNDDGSDWGTATSNVRPMDHSEKFASIQVGNHSATHAGKFGFGEFVRGMVGQSSSMDVRNALSEGTDSAGGVTVPQHVMSRLIDRMRSKLVTSRAGALSIPLETEKTTIARLASDPTASWRLENAAVAESDPSFEAVQFQARSLACLVKVPQELLQDSVNLEDALLNAFAGSMAVELDRVALFGSGSAPEPLGLVNNPNIGQVSMGTDGAAITDYSPMLDALHDLKAANANEPSAMVMAPRTWRQVAGLTDSTGQPLNPPPAVSEVPMLTSTSVPIDDTQGTSTDASPLIVGDFSQLLIGIRTQLRIRVLQEAFANNLQYGFLADLRADVAVAQPGAFSVIEGITPA